MTSPERNAQTMERETIEAFLESIIRTARRAGEGILAVAAGDLDAVEKDDGSPLTRADLASHEAIMAGLAPLEPAWPVLSEEGDLDTTGGGWHTYWCVDPLDGTKEFVKGLDEYTVNIALVEAGRPILGVVHLPVTDVTYWGGQGLGAFKCTGNSAPQAIAPSSARTPGSAVISRSHPSAETEAFLQANGITNVIPHGSSLKICAVAEGAADVYPRLGPTCLWDTAAGAAVAIAAGCEVIDLAGAPLSYDVANGLKREGFIVYPTGMDLRLEGGQ